MRMLRNFKKNTILFFVVIFSLVSLISCAKVKSESSQETTQTIIRNTTEHPETTVSVATTEEVSLVIESAGYEAEEGVFFGGVKLEQAGSDYSGLGYVSGFTNDDSACEIKIQITQDGFYDLNFISKTNGDYKANTIYVDGNKIGEVSVESNKFSDSISKQIHLEKGDHIVRYEKLWGHVSLDKLIVTQAQALDTSIYDIEATLINPNATKRTKQLMKYLTDIYGKSFLSGQYADKGMGSNEFAAIKNSTGELPAVLGLDFIEYSGSRVSNGSTSKATTYATSFDKFGGIVTFCWHWNAPEKYLTDIWWKGFNTDATNIDLKKIMNGEDKEGYQLLLDDIERIAEQCLILQEKDIPILFRPLHEASGGWFWWGASGSEAYKKLWVLLYEELTNTYKVNNLIWLWNGEDKDWYPGDEYVDMIGVDIYAGEKVYTSQVDKYLEAVDYGQGKKMVVLSENGTVFDPDLALRDGAMWGFFATWGGEFVIPNSNSREITEQYTEESLLKKVYAHDRVITLSKLPNLKEYPLEGD